MRSVIFTMLTAHIITWLMPSQVVAQPKVIKSEGTIQVGVFEFEAKNGDLFWIRAKGNTFRPQLSVQGRNRFDSKFDFQQQTLSEGLYRCRENGTQRIFILPATFNLKVDGPLKYTIELDPIHINPKPILKVAGMIANSDPIYGPSHRSFHKSYEVKLQANKYYVIDMIGQGPNDMSRLDTYLLLEDSKKKVVERDDDGGPFSLSARIVFRPAETATYRIIASTFSQGTGDFILEVREQAE